MDATEDVKKLASHMFDIVAQAEAKAHGVPIEEVHFHEVGAVDSIIDIVGTAYCIRSLGIDEVYISPLYEGQGHVRCAHGMLPVPVPAVRNIVEAHTLPMTITESRGEMVTPTGAAIAAALWNGKKLPAGVRFVKTGIGAGEKDFPHANILRISVVEVEQQEPTLWVLETNMDDVTGEALGYTMEKLMAAGARDTYYRSIFMKKGRPAYLLRVICNEADIEKLENIIFTHTTTIGIRRYPIQRHILEREIITIDTEWGKARVKKCVLENGVRMYPEYEDVRRPAGEYCSLRVMIGEASGQNWWCVLFPPLCVGTASAKDELVSAGFTPDQVRILTDSDSPKYVLRFKILEILESLFS